MPLYTQASAMEPMLPGEDRELAELSHRLVLAAGALSGAAHPVTARGIARLVRLMNSYYSNLIEGHQTNPIQIERALRKDFARRPEQKALQMESVAHVRTQEAIEARMRAEPNLEICAEPFLRDAHREFYAQMPEEFRIVGGEQVSPGQLRSGEVRVGQHIAPKAAALPKFLARFAEAYKPASLNASDWLIAAAAAHHRLTWIHPFLDGNGRVARLFSQAYLARAGVDSHGLWAASRGLARRKEQYFQALAHADQKRRNDLDGRGNLSASALKAFCVFFLEVCLDQVQFMKALLDLDPMRDRIGFFAERWTRERRVDERVGRMLQQAFSRGELTRGEAAEVLDRPERTSRRVMTALLDAGLLDTDGPGKPVRMAFPTYAVGYYFPRLYPEGVELETRGEPLT